MVMDNAFIWAKKETLLLQLWSKKKSFQDKLHVAQSEIFEYLHAGKLVEADWKITGSWISTSVLSTIWKA